MASACSVRRINVMLPERCPTVLFLIGRFAAKAKVGQKSQLDSDKVAVSGTWGVPMGLYCFLELLHDRFAARGLNIDPMG